MKRLPRVRLGKTERQHMRRMIVLRWFLGGFMLNGRRMSTEELALQERVSEAVITADIKICKRHLASFSKSSPLLKQELQAMFHAVILQAQEDRGRALEQFEELNKEMHKSDGTRKRTVTKYNTDVGYQMVAFLRQAQQSTDTLAKLLKDLTGKGDVNLLMVDNRQQNIFTIEDAVRKLEEQKLTRALPTSTDAIPIEMKRGKDFDKIIVEGE